MKGRVVFTAVLLALAVSGIAAGQGSVFTFGANYWKAQWNIEGIEPGHMFGPYVNLRSGRMTLGGSFFTGTFKPDESEDIFGDDIDLKRNDLNLSVGYNLGRFFNVFGAYKRTNWNIKGTVEDIVYDDWTDTWYVDDIEIDEEEEGSYLGGGASIVFPFTNSPLFLYGSGAFLAAQKKDWTDITTVTVGAGYRLSPQLTLMAGFRSDLYGDPEDSDDDSGEKEKIQGLTVSLAYTLR
ncbi:hypothetical protein JW777_01900 [bacterium]|nr:hypothetical protein [bacterium]